MLEAPRMWRGFLGLFQPSTADRLHRVVDESMRSVTGYMLGNGATSVIAGIIVGVTLEILGVPFALLLGVFVALVDLLPLVGGLLAGFPVVIIAAIHSVPAGITMLVVFIVYQQLENHILNPIIMSKTVQLNPFWVLIAVLVGATLGGRVAGGLGTFVGALVGHPGRRGDPGHRPGAPAWSRGRRGPVGTRNVARPGSGRHLNNFSCAGDAPRRPQGVGAGQRRNQARPPRGPVKGPGRQPPLECLHATAGGHPDLQRVGEH